MRYWPPDVEKRTIEFNLPTELLEDLIMSHLNAISVIDDDEIGELIHNLPKTIPIKLELTKEHKMEIIRT